MSERTIKQQIWLNQQEKKFIQENNEKRRYMAVIKIKTIKKNLQAVVNYTKNGEKTEHGILVSGVNYLSQFAYEQIFIYRW